jgi:hypothetical protein
MKKLIIASTLAYAIIIAAALSLFYLSCYKGDPYTPVDPTYPPNPVVQDPCANPDPTSAYPCPLPFSTTKIDAGIDASR